MVLPPFRITSLDAVTPVSTKGSPVPGMMVSERVKLFFTMTAAVPSIVFGWA